MIRRALVLAPLGRDAAVAVALLGEARVVAVTCPELASLERSLDTDVTFVVVAEEALRGADLRNLSQWIAAQASWSDLPFIVLTQRGGGVERNPDAARLAEVLGHVTFLERPFHPTTFLSVARVALRNRMRQYEARTRLDDLHEADARLRTALLAGHLGSWEFDLATGTLEASSTCKALFGRGPDDAFGYEDLIASIHPEDRARMQQAVRHTMETGADFSIEYRNVWPDGSIHWADIRARVVRDRDDSRSRLVGVSADITERKQSEQALRDMNETLEQRVAARSEELERAHRVVLEQRAQRERAEEQLRQAQKMELVGQLTGGVAHDFNNLLMVVLVNLELLRRQVPESEVTARLIDGAVRSARRGALLTQRLLAFSRRQELTLEGRDLAGLLHDMRDLLERSLGPAIELELQLPQDLPPALVDVNQVELAVLNLVVNARDAMPEGGRLTVDVDEGEPSAEEGLPAGRYLRIAVADTGHGMDAETLRRATEPFFSTKEVGKGTGLGLSMIHGLAVQLHGALRLQSSPGRGTRAELWLPAAPELTESAADNDIAGAPGEPLPAMKVLLVDDDELITEGTRSMLEALGHEVITADSGPAALALLEQHTDLDLVITDYAMPQMTGAQLAQAVRQQRPALPILLATGYAEFPQGAGRDLPRIVKPYHQAQLAAEIRRQVCGSKLQA